MNQPGALRVDPVRLALGVELRDRQPLIVGLLHLEPGGPQVEDLVEVGNQAPGGRLDLQNQLAVLRLALVEHLGDLELLERPDAPLGGRRIDGDRRRLDGQDHVARRVHEVEVQPQGGDLVDLGAARLEQQIGIGRHPPAVFAGGPGVDLLVLEGHREHLELLLECLLDDVLELVAIVLQRPAEVVIEISLVVLVLKIAAEPSRFALDLAGVPEVDEDAERLFVARPRRRRRRRSRA